MEKQTMENQEAQPTAEQNPPPPPQESNGTNGNATNGQQQAAIEKESDITFDRNKNTEENNNVNPDLSTLMDVDMSLSIEIGRAQIKLKDLLNLSKGSIVELNKLSGEPLDILANGKLIAHGDVISMNGKYGIRLTDVPNKLDKPTGS